MTRHPPEPSRCFRRALVTGASRGIGAAFAEALPSSTDLLLHGRDEEALSGIASRLRRPGRRIEIVPGDLSTAAGRVAVVDAGARAEIDLLISNAGSGTFRDFLATPPEDLEAAISLNALAPAALLRGLLPSMVARARAGGPRAGAVVVSSSLAFLPVPRLAAYSASKAFTLTLTEALAQELGAEEVDILAVCPGPTRTEFGRRAGYHGGHPPGALSPDSVARTALHALGRRRTVVTGPLRGFPFDPLARARNVAARAAGLGVRLLERW